MRLVTFYLVSGETIQFEVKNEQERIDIEFEFQEQARCVQCGIAWSTSRPIAKL